MIILANYGFSYPETRKALCEAMPTTSGNDVITLNNSKEEVNKND